MTVKENYQIVIVAFSCLEKKELYSFLFLFMKICTNIFY